MKTPSKILVGVITFTLFVSTLLIHYNFIAGNISLVVSEENARMINFFVINNLLVFCLILFYLIFLASNEVLSRGRKVLWMILAVILNIYIMPVIYFLYILRVRSAGHR